METVISQTMPDFFFQKPAEMVRKNTNPRYKFFRQNYFTAGDYEQFLQYWDAKPSETTLSMTSTGADRIRETDRISFLPCVEWKKYQNICIHDVFHTFMYISEKFKKGIFVRLGHRHDGSLNFLPFSKVNFTNEWFSKIQVNRQRFASVRDLMEFIATQESRPFVEGRVHKDVKAWYGNNGLVRLEFPISEGDSGCNMLKNMMDCLVKERDVPDFSFFLNKRDFPVLTNDGTESYASFFGEHQPLLSHAYDKYAPIFSMTTTDRHADIPIPTWEDWCRVSYWEDQKRFAKEFRTYPLPEELDAIPWNDRVPTAVFRGASTGLGTTTCTNPRLFFAAESAKRKKDTDGIPFLDAGITAWNLRPRKHPQSPYLDTIHISDMPFSLVRPLTVLEQARYKYVLHLPGHSFAYRLSLELFSGSVVLLYPCCYRLWYSHLLRPWVHYVPLDPKVSDDIYKKIRWCKSHDAECQEMARRAREFAHKYLTRDAILDYLQALIHRCLSLHQGVRYSRQSLEEASVHHITSLLDRIEDEEKAFVQNPGLRFMFEKIEKDVVMSRRSFSFYYYWIRHALNRDANLLENAPSQLVIKTKHTEIYKMELLSKLFIMKKSQKGGQSFHHLASKLLGYVGMNELASKIPNFIHTYMVRPNKDSIEWMTMMDYAGHTTLEHFLKNPVHKVRMVDVMDILLLVTLSLHVAQQRLGFLHMDLYPWNVMIHRLDSPVCIEYPVSNTTSVKIKTRLLPIIVDYEKSYFVHEGIHYYSTVPFRFCRLQDVLCLVFSCFSIYLEKNILSNSEIQQVLNIMNFFSSDYTDHISFHSVAQVKHFLKKHKKFSKMMYEPKKGLETVSPMDFFHHIIQKPLYFNVSIQWETGKKNHFMFLPQPPQLFQTHLMMDLFSTVYPVVSDEEKTTIEGYVSEYWKRVSTLPALVRKDIVGVYTACVVQHCGHLVEKAQVEGIVSALVASPRVAITKEMGEVVRQWLSPSREWPNVSKNRIPPLLPCFTSHLCPRCIQKQAPANLDRNDPGPTMREFQQWLYSWYSFSLSSSSPPEEWVESIDYFLMWTQGFPHEFSSLVHDCV